ncbi:hypothetical protein Hanom_Chr05g00388561 [Helianthus anomalus]
MGWLIMHHVVALIAKRQRGTCTNRHLSQLLSVTYVQGLMQNYNRVGCLIGSSLSILTGRGKAIYISPSSDPTLVLLLVGYTEYDDDDVLSCFYRDKWNIYIIIYM